MIEDRNTTFIYENKSGALFPNIGLLCFVIIGLFKSLSAHGQAVNDNISNRSSLILNGIPIQSTTQEATVEWACINKRMTQKCLVFHNDQWFTFTPAQDGRYFINVSAGRCRDLRGIQAIVIEGNPCQIDTYKMLRCIDQIRHSEVYIELDSMRANIQYLINIDGFLGDNCDFTIQVSNRANGLPVNPVNGNALSLIVQKQPSLNVLHWKLPEDFVDSVKSFEINRIVNDRLSAVPIAELPINLNTKGDVTLDYSYRDTVSTRVIAYEIVGKLRDDRKVVLDKVTTIGVPTQIPDEQVIAFTLDENDNSQLHIAIVDPTNDVVLREKTLTYRAVLDHTQKIYIGDLIVRGILNFDVYIVNNSYRKTRKMQFKATADGVILQK